MLSIDSGTLMRMKLDKTTQQLMESSSSADGSVKTETKKKRTMAMKETTEFGVAELHSAMFF